MAKPKNRQHDGFGLMRADWDKKPPPSDPDDPPHYAEARAAGFEAGKAILTAAEAARQLAEEVELLAQSLGTAGLPRLAHPSACQSTRLAGIKSPEL
jgi:hypothetical protein